MFADPGQEKLTPGVVRVDHPLDREQQLGRPLNLVDRQSPTGDETRRIGSGLLQLAGFVQRDVSHGMLSRGNGLNQGGLPDLSSPEQAYDSCLRKAIDNQ